MQGYDGDAAELVHISADGVAVVAFVHDDVGTRAQVGTQEGLGLVEVGNVGAGENEAEGITQGVAGEMNFGGEAGFGAAHRLGELATGRASAMGVHAHRRAVDEQILVVACRCTQCGLDGGPKAVARPSAKAGINALPGAKGRRQIAPPYAGAQHPQDCFHPQALISTATAAPLRPT